MKEEVVEEELELLQVPDRGQGGATCRCSTPTTLSSPMVEEECEGTLGYKTDRSAVAAPTAF